MYGYMPINRILEINSSVLFFYISAFQCKNSNIKRINEFQMLRWEPFPQIVYCSVMLAFTEILTLSFHPVNGITFLCVCITVYIRKLNPTANLLQRDICIYIFLVIPTIRVYTTYLIYAISYTHFPRKTNNATVGWYVYMYLSKATCVFCILLYM